MLIRQFYGWLHRNAAVFIKRLIFAIEGLALKTRFLRGPGPTGSFPEWLTRL